MMPKKIDGKMAVIMVLAAALVITIGYIGVGKYQETQTQKQLAVYQQGAQAGYEQAIVQLVQQVSTCQQVPVIVGNQTINVIAVECLQG
ncbi:MAG: hypothetical protein ISS95_00110 [Candidatus Aenigmarchaeota archaeon]|nr:hypothetical protein [Candidatus Aenigmarchaeota archaeon]